MMVDMKLGCVSIIQGPAGGRLAHFTEGIELSLLETSLQRCGQGDVTPNWRRKLNRCKGRERSPVPGE